MQGFFVSHTRKYECRCSLRLITAAAFATTALLIDGIVVAWFPAVYGGHLPQVTDCAAIILWGAGVALLLGFFMNKGEYK